MMQPQIRYVRSADGTRIGKHSWPIGCLDGERAARADSRPTRAERLSESRQQRVVTARWIVLIRCWPDALLGRFST